MGFFHLSSIMRITCGENVFVPRQKSCPPLTLFLDLARICPACDRIQICPQPEILSLLGACFASNGAGTFWSLLAVYCVYMIRAKGGQSIFPVKIGKAKTDILGERLQDFQIGNWFRLEVIKRFDFASHEEAMEVESAIHNRFSSHRCSGEWFFPTEEIMSLMTDGLPEDIHDYASWGRGKQVSYKQLEFPLSGSDICNSCRRRSLTPSVKNDEGTYTVLPVDPNLNPSGDDVWFSNGNASWSVCWDELAEAISDLPDAKRRRVCEDFGLTKRKAAQ